MYDEITIRGARLHNLKNVSFSIPKNRFIVFTGLSGSGKSTMAFDTLHKEGQRQYIESLGLMMFVSRPHLVGDGYVADDQRGPEQQQPLSALDLRHGDRRLHLSRRIARSAPSLPELWRGRPPQHESDEAPEMIQDDENSLDRESYVSCPNCGYMLLALDKGLSPSTSRMAPALPAPAWARSTPPI